MLFDYFLPVFQGTPELKMHLALISCRVLLIWNVQEINWSDFKDIGFCWLCKSPDPHPRHSQVWTSLAASSSHTLGRTSLWLLTLCAEPSGRLRIEAINLCDSSYLEFLLLLLIRKWQSLSALCMNLREICNPNHVLLTKWKTKCAKPGFEITQMVLRAWVMTIEIIFVLSWIAIGNSSLS